MRTYLNQLRLILEKGIEKNDRTGTGTLSLFGMQAHYDLDDGFPLVTTKKVLFDAVVWELLWFLKGSTNINEGLAGNTPIWNAWADENGDLGPIYGYQWRKWPKYIRDEKTGQYTQSHIDQIQWVIDEIKNNPSSRRLIVNAWNVSDLDKMALPPCHAFFQFNVTGEKLNLQLYQRSADMALGVPFNIASYSLLLILVANETGYKPGVFVHTLGDAHIYKNHIEGIEKQLKRNPFPLPKVEIASKPLNDITFEDIKLIGYQHHPFIKFKVAV